MNYVQINIFFALILTASGKKNQTTFGKKNETTFGKKNQTTFGEEFVDTSAWEGMPEKCGKTRFLGKEVPSSIRGKAATGQFPWVTRVGYRSAKTKELIFYCGGTLVSKHYVISATKCGATAKIVRVGEYDIYSELDCDDCDNKCAPPHQDIRVNRRIMAEECAVDKTNEISILELKRAVVFNDFVQPLCIPRKIGAKPFLRKFEATAVGWGISAINSRGRSWESMLIKDMMFISRPLKAAAHCNGVYVKGLEKSQLCIGFPKSSKTVCVGDFGGGLVSYKTVGSNEFAYLAAVATQELSNCDMNRRIPAIFTDVSYFSDWIVKTIKEAAAIRVDEKDGDDDKVIDDDDDYYYFVTENNEIVDSVTDKVKKSETFRTFDETLATNNKTVWANETASEDDTEME